MVSSKCKGLRLLWMLAVHHSIPAHGIVNGYRATFGRNPWQALLLFKDSDPDLICGGSLIHPRYVITAAHCVFDKKQWITWPASQITVRLGEHDRGNDAEPTPHQNFAVQEVIVHERYWDDGHLHDIALLKLAKNVALNEHINIIPLAAKTAGSFEGISAKVSGWGHQNYYGGKASRILREVDVEVFKQKECHDSWASDPNSTVVITDHHLCAGSSPRGNDTCKGDSGGPLTVALPRRGASNNAELIGVVRGGVCGWPERPPGVYMRVTAG